MFSSVKRLIKRWVPGAPTFSETNEQHTPQKTDDGGLAAMDVPPTPVEERQFKAPSPRYNRSPTQQPNIRPQPDFRQPNTPVRLFTPAQHTPTRNVTPYNPNTPTERQLRYMEQLRPEDGWITSASRRLNRLPTLAPGTPKRMPVSQLTVDESVLAGNKRGRDDDDEYERFDPSSQPVAVKRRQIEYEESVVTRTPLRRSSAPQRQVTPRSRIKLKSSRPNANKDLRWLISRMPPVDHDKTDQMAKNLLENTEKLYRDQREAEERKVVEENNRVNGLRMAEEQRRAAEQRKIDDERREEAELARQQKAQLDEQARKQAEEQKRAEQPPQTNAASSGFAFKPPAQQVGVADCFICSQYIILTCVFYLSCSLHRAKNRRMRSLRQRLRLFSIPPPNQRLLVHPQVPKRKCRYSEWRNLPLSRHPQNLPLHSSERERKERHCLEQRPRRVWSPPRLREASPQSMPLQSQRLRLGQRQHLLQLLRRVPVLQHRSTSTRQWLPQLPQVLDSPRPRPMRRLHPLLQHSHLEPWQRAARRLLEVLPIRPQSRLSQASAPACHPTPQRKRPSLLQPVQALQRRLLSAVRLPPAPLHSHLARGQRRPMVRLLR
ncbi:uncharacterized protein EV422DRAFT_23368 [Fimicolochytrium jonesii]|uniref:uncharacterized protein n=1 Tax=Fimicolochytrium jonesii TaxID=1396493 RepID=UPI0022FDBF80|nr:uncharacterized protein EV422DRAFT_23368 [Fimicolochytrium jonesii]KAI8827042.1 hypothetical protein EV422DRAFT_23368 [Fimicolochytrium jonesii]